MLGTDFDEESHLASHEKNVPDFDDKDLDQLRGNESLILVKSKRFITKLCVIHFFSEEHLEWYESFTPDPWSDENLKIVCL